MILVAPENDKMILVNQENGKIVCVAQENDKIIWCVFLKMSLEENDKIIRSYSLVCFFVSEGENHDLVN